MPLQLTSAQDLFRSANVPAQNAATILALVQFSAVPAGYTGALALFRNASSREICILSRNGTQMDFYWTNGGSSASRVLATGLAANTWYWLAITSAGTAIGNLIGYLKADTANSWTTISNNSTVDSLAPDRIFVNDDGYNSGGTSNMVVGGLKVWDAVLTAEELLNEAQCIRPLRLANLNLWAPMVDLTLAGCNTDYSGNGRTLSNGGTPTVSALSIPIPWRVGASTKRRFSPPAGGGPTQYNQTVGGALSFVGGLARQTGLVRAGALSFAGGLVRQVNLARTGSLGFTGALARRTEKALSGSVSFAGAINKQLQRAVSGALSFSATLGQLRVFNVIMTGALSFTGALSKRTEKFVNGALGFAGAVVKQTTKSFSGALSFSGGLVKRTSKAFVGVLSFSATLVANFTFIRAISGSLTFLGNLATLLIPGGPPPAGYFFRRLTQAFTRIFTDKNRNEES